MLVKKLQKLNDLLINFIYFIIILFIPLSFSILLKTNNVFELPKIILFKILVLILIFLITVQFVFQPNKLKLYKKYKNYIFFIFILFLYYFINSYFFSINQSLSLFGTYDRIEGLESYLYYFLFFLISLYFFQNKKNVKLTLFTMFLPGIVVSIYAIAQAWGLDPLGWSESTEARATSTLGQPNALGSYLLLVIPIGAYFFVIFKKWYLKALFGLGMLINLLALFYTYSTASWIGLVGGVFILGLIFFLCHPGNAQHYPGSRGKSFKQDKADSGLKISKASDSGSWIALWASRMTQKRMVFFVVIVVALIFSSYFFINFKTPSTLKVKIENVLNWETGSTAARFDFWSATWSAIKERPFFGYGIETQQEVLAKYYEPGWAVHSNINVRPSRAHNIILDTWLTTGIIGVILFSIIWFYLFRIIIINIKAGREKILNYCILFSLTSLLIYLQFNFYHITAWAYFVVFSAIAISTKHDSMNNLKLNIQSKFKILNSKLIKYLLIIFVSITLAITTQLIYHEYAKYTADHYYWEIRRSRVSNEYFSALKLYEYIKEVLPGYSYYDQKFALLMTDWLRDFNDPRFSKFGEEKLIEILPQMPTNTFFEKYNKAKVLVALADYDINYFNQAEKIYQELIDYSPFFPLINREYAYMLRKSAQFERASEQYKYALEILPSLDTKGLNKLHEARIKGEMKVNYQGLIDVYEKLGDDEAVNKYNSLLADLGDK